MRGHSFLSALSLFCITTLVLPGYLFAQEPNSKNRQPEVTPVEDLLREHGLLNRLLLIYDTIRQRVESGQEIPSQQLSDAANIIRRFIESYHEKLEEEDVFPRLERAGKMTDLAKLLRKQHDAGRRVTNTILKNLTPRTPQERQFLAKQLESFVRMYRPHAAREATVLFPAFHTVVTQGEYDALGRVFEQRETALFGEGGFEKMVNAVAEIERYLGLEDLSQFTPR